MDSPRLRSLSLRMHFCLQVCLPQTRQMFAQERGDKHNLGFTVFWFPRATDLCTAPERKALARKALKYERTRAGLWDRRSK
jgi:hypothetical protein